MYSSAFWFVIQCIRRIQDLLKMEKDEVYVFITFDSLKKKKGGQYHDLVLWWSRYFADREIPLYIGTRDSFEELKKIKLDYGSNIEYISFKEAKDVSWMQEKLVFGNCYQILSSNIFVISEQKIVKIYKRINEKSLESAYFTALDAKYKNFLKKFKKTIDITQKLW